MREQPDDIFRVKLRDYSPPVPASAWDRIPAPRQQKFRSPWWLKAAAAILLAACTGALLTALPEKTPVAVTQSADFETNVAPQAFALPAPEELTPPPPPTEQADPLPAERSRRPIPAGAALALKKNPAQPRFLPDEHEAAQEVAADVQAVVEEAGTVARDPQENARVTIVFTAREVNEKYLLQKNEAEATPGAETTSSLKRLLARAQDLTFNRDPLGDIREAKNIILAFQEKNETTHAHNE